MGWKRLALITAALAVWYPISNNPAKYNPVKTDPSFTLEQKTKAEALHTLPKEIQGNGYTIPTDSINFEQDFTLQTPRYSVIKKEDWGFFQGIGYLFSIPSKLFFWDANISAGLDGKHTKDLVAILENDTTVHNLQVRVNHASIADDLERLFTDPQVRARNNILSRIVQGIPQTIAQGIYGELTRGDTYNSLTQTVVIYSNVNAIPDHELGHHRDHQRFSADWWYSFARAIPPVMLYQEWRASQYAKKDLAPEEKYQFPRYLIPAFGTYCLAVYGSLRKHFKKKEKKRKQLPRYDDPDNEFYQEPGASNLRYR